MASNDVQHADGFQYMDEDSIDVDLKCSICIEPFAEPGTIWSCDHTFCRECIEKIPIRMRACPQCRSVEMLKEFRNANRILINMLNKVLVRCNYCMQENIERGHFREHVNKFCPQIIVTCPAGEHLCPWTGCRDQLAAHRAQCTVELREFLRGQFADITEEIKQLQLNVRDINLLWHKPIDYDKRRSDMMRYDQYCPTLESINEQLKLQLLELDQQIDRYKQRLPSLQITGQLFICTLLS
jgi:hypothetical protein